VTALCQGDLYSKNLLYRSPCSLLRTLAADSCIVPKTSQYYFSTMVVVGSVIAVRKGVVFVNGPCLLDYLILKLRLPVVLYVSFAVDSRELLTTRSSATAEKQRVSCPHGGG